MGSLVSLVTYAATGRFWWFATWDLLLAPATVAVAAFAFHVKNGARWVEARFDRDLQTSLVELGAILNTGPTRQDPEVVETWIAQANRRALGVLHTLERLKAPSPEWNELLVAYIETGVTPEQRRLMVAEGAMLARKYGSLRGTSTKRQDPVSGRPAS